MLLTFIRAKLDIFLNSVGKVKILVKLATLYMFWNSVIAKASRHGWPVYILVEPRKSSLLVMY